MTRKSLNNGDLRREMDKELMSGIKSIAGIQVSIKNIELKIDSFVSGCKSCQEEIDSLKQFRSNVVGATKLGSFITGATALIALIFSWWDKK